MVLLGSQTENKGTGHPCRLTILKNFFLNKSSFHTVSRLQCRIKYRKYITPKLNNTDNPKTLAKLSLTLNSKPKKYIPTFALNVQKKIKTNQNSLLEKKGN